MEIKIGILHSNRELSVRLDNSLDVAEQVADLKSQLNDSPVVSFTEESGRSVIVPTDKVAYIDLHSESARTVGFGEV